MAKSIVRLDGKTIIYPRKPKRGGIWVGNKFDKPWVKKKKNRKYIKPVVKRCKTCKRRVVKHHHFLCPKCWEFKQAQKGEVAA